MRIRKVMDKKVGEAVYYKFLITLPRKAVEESRLFGNDLKIKTEKNKIIISNE
jgi:hypothetical protein